LADAAEVSRDRSASPDEQPLISAIVPTKDRPAALARCLGALSAQTVAEALEVIVVDDGSLAAEEVSQVVARHRPARLIRRAGGGPAAARNAGVQQARGSLLCFTDDDCTPHEEWAERLAEALEAGADAAAGITLGGGGALAGASEIVAHAPAGVRAGDDGKLAFAPSNNLACTRTVFESIRFDESYPSAAGEDRDWCARVIAAGYVLRLAPNARVVHHQDLSLASFVRQQFRYGKGAYRFRRRSGDRRPLESRSFYTALLRRAFTESISIGVLVSAAQLATAAGFALAWAEQRRNALQSRTAGPPRLRIRAHMSTERDRDRYDRNETVDDMERHPGGDEERPATAE
jgi:glycosyltransferase involved in cell wall biosynthesis